MTPTAAQHAWIQEAFGIDPVAYVASAAPAAAPANPALLKACAKAGDIWLATCRKVEGDIGKLQTTFEAAFKDHAKAGDIHSAFGDRVTKVIDQFDDELAHTLKAIAAGGDPAQHDKLVAQARDTIKRYLAFVAGDPTIAELDKNPFVPLSLQATLTGSLSALSKTLA